MTNEIYFHQTSKCSGDKATRIRLLKELPLGLKELPQQPIRETVLGEAVRGKRTGPRRRFPACCTRGRARSDACDKLRAAARIGSNEHEAHAPGAQHRLPQLPLDRVSSKAYSRGQLLQRPARHPPTPARPRTAFLEGFLGRFFAEECIECQGLLAVKLPRPCVLRAPA